MDFRLAGLVAATHTPFTSDGELDLAGVDRQAEHLLDNAVRAVFIAGSTGECHSLTTAERLALADRWMAVTRDTPMEVVVHVGSNCLADSRTLAAHAQKLGANAIAALSPSYFKPRTLDDLIECSRSVAAAAPELPFYFYDIPIMTGVQFSIPDYLERAAEKIPTLVGTKFSNPDLMAYQRCIRMNDCRFDMPWGTDEYFLAALAVGAVGAVGSSYNFAAPIFNGLYLSFWKDEFAVARERQFRGVQVIHLLGTFGYHAAARAVMGMIGVPVGPPRLPFTPLTADQEGQLREELQKLGFFDWIQNY